ncbi:ABC-three component system protein [Scandinavium sp. M-37]|uniref:ABC-three component system protein n=1 Tax=Scandinavium sp. M-37 TaxID=3373077 RepID=UPI0037456080
MFTTHQSEQLTQQKDNKVDGGGSIVGRDQHNHFYAHQGISRELLDLYERLKIDGVGERSIEFCEKLNHYMTPQTETDVRGLDAKLADGNRNDLLMAAKLMKEQATKAIMKRQTSKTAQRIFVLILDRIYFDFLLKVTPLIQCDSDRVIVDDKISQIIESLYSTLGENLLELTAIDLLGLLFFLGGNCHIRWDKC